MILKLNNASYETVKLLAYMPSKLTEFANADSQTRPSQMILGLNNLLGPNQN